MLVGRRLAATHETDGGEAGLPGAALAGEAVIGHHLPVTGVTRGGGGLLLVRGDAHTGSH